MTTYYQLHNDEMGWITDCPTFENKREAEYAAADKCRFHSVVEITEDELIPCKPLTLYAKCLKCPRCAAPWDARVELKRQLGLD